MKLHSTWDVRSAAGEPAATVRVQSLGASLTGPADAWGRTGRPQPSETTVEVNMSRAFRSSSAADAVQDDTVHYGLLSKEVLRLIADATDAGTQGTRLVTLKKTVADIVLRLVGVDLLLGEDQGPAAANGSGAQNQAPFLPAAAINSIHVTLLLSKASLLGDGASITGSAVVCPVSPSTPRLRAVTLKIHNVRVPTLIGVNSNEREAEQMVLANLEVGKWVGVPDGYVELERVVYKVCHFLSISI